MTKYVPITSVLYRIALTLKEKDYDELRMTEWLTMGYKSFPTNKKFSTNLCLLEVENHTANIPDNLVTPNQIIYKGSITEGDVDAIRQMLAVDQPPASNYDSLYTNLPNRVLDANTMEGWAPVRKSTSTMIAPEIENRDACADCTHTYSFNPLGCITTSFQTGFIIISYEGYPTNEEGIILIPDDETVKTALEHFVYYRRLLERPFTKELERRLTFHLGLYQTNKAKAIGFMNEPDIDDMENIKDQRNRIFNSSYRYDQFFATLGNRAKPDNLT